MDHPGEKKALGIQFLEEKGGIRTIEEALQLEVKYRAILTKPASTEESGIVLQYMLDNRHLKIKK